MARKKSPEPFLTYLLRRKLDFYIFATIWVALAGFWLLFPGITDGNDRYSLSIRSIVIYGWPVWLAIAFVVHKGWLKISKGTKKQ